MEPKYFVRESSIVREIWGNGDTILFIFAGAAAEFALNKAVDWLYFTGKLPADPLGRLFSTVGYARTIVFADETTALRAIDSIAAIHSAVEKGRGAQIPDWAYRDVLFMLVGYSISAYELLHRQLTPDEKQEAFGVFLRIGERMGIPGLPQTFAAYEVMRQSHLLENLHRSEFTDDLFMQYRKHLGPIRFAIMVESQKLVVPKAVSTLLRHKRGSAFPMVLSFYKFSRVIKADAFLKGLILPAKYKKEILALDRPG